MPGGVVGTVMTNFGLELACKARGIPFARAAVGDRHVHEMLRQRGWVLGGEKSGHILCLEKSTTGDGIIAALDVLESMITKDQPLSALTSAMEVFPQTNINVSLKNGRQSPEESIKQAAVQEALREVEQTLGTEGRVVLRPSGTEPVIRVMVEGRDQSVVSVLGRRLAEAVAAVETGA
jgi:phosphoglucosamine mutase